MYIINSIKDTKGGLFNQDVIKYEWGDFYALF